MWNCCRPALAALALLLTPAAWAAAPPPAPGLRTPAAPISGALVVCGGGGTPDSVRQRFVELAGGKKARLVVIPSASARAPSERSLDPWKKAGVASAVLLHARDRAQAGEAAFAKPLREATGVWLGGGDQNRLTALYAGTSVEKELRAVLARGGVVGGTSAGAAVLSPLMITGGNPVAGVGRGFGLLPGVVVDQHFLRRDRVNRLLGVLARHPGYAGLGVDEKAAVVVRGRTLTVVGDSYAVLCLPASRSRPVSVQVLKPGGTADLVTLSRAAIARAGPAFPADRPAAPDVGRGALVIGGGGGMPLEVLKRFVALAGGPDARVVVVPTALPDPVPAEPREVQALKRAGARDVVVLHTRDRKKADSAAFVAPLRKAGGVWFTGGRQWRFVDAYEGTAAERAFHDVLRRGGVIGGSSAGASIQSEYMPRGHPLGNREMIAEGYERGFGFLKGVAVDQHFFARKRTADMTGLIAAYPQLLGVGVDEGTAAVVRGSVLEVMGRSTVAVYDAKKSAKGGKDYEELRPGQRYDLKARKRVGGEE